MESGTCCLSPVPIYYRGRCRSFEGLVGSLRNPAAAAADSGGGSHRCSHLLGMIKSEIMKFRDSIRLPRRSASSTLNELLICTLEDLQKTYPICKSCFQISEANHNSVHQESKEVKNVCDDTSKSNGLSKMLWRAFQLAFRVYNFAGGQDERADKLTSELAHEIESCPLL